MFDLSAGWQSLIFESWRAGYFEVQIIHGILAEIGVIYLHVLDYS